MSTNGHDKTMLMGRELKDGNIRLDFADCYIILTPQIGHRLGGWLLDQTRVAVSKPALDKRHAETIALPFVEAAD